MTPLAIFGCPRSGTSWLGQIFNASPAVLYRYQPLFSYEFKDWFGRHGLTERTLAEFHAALAGAASDFVLQDLRPPKQAAPTHLVWKEVRYHQWMAPLMALKGLRQIVYLVRPPLDVINSWYQAPKEFRAGQDIRREWLDAPSKNTDPCEFNGLARWKRSLHLALQLRAAHGPRLQIVSYERLRADPSGQARALFEALGIAWDPAVDAFLAASTSRHDADAYSVFKAERAQQALPADIVARIRADAEAAELLGRAESLALASADQACSV